MRIYDIEKVKEGHWITFISRYEDKLIRRFYKIIGINDNKFYYMKKHPEWFLKV